MNRRGFLQLLGAGAAVTAAGLLVPDVGRKIFLPPKGGWAQGSGLNFGDVLTFEGVHDPLVIRRCKQFVVTSSDGLTPHDRVRYDAVWTRADTGEEEQFGIDAMSDSSDPLVQQAQDATARSTLENLMRKRNGRPGGTQFKLLLPSSSTHDARYI